eukprot:5026946-Prymnesium_polylepis.2
MYFYTVSSCQARVGNWKHVPILGAYTTCRLPSYLLSTRKPLKGNAANYDKSERNQNAPTPAPQLLRPLHLQQGGGKPCRRAACAIRQIN